MKARSSRLKNFCDVCRKQCKDENGYHCHLNSASHQRRLRQYITNPNEHIEKYSKELEWKFVQLLKTKYPGEQKQLESIYEQYSQQKYHVQFSSTQWKNLQQFAQHLKTLKNISITGNYPNMKITYLISKSSDFMKDLHRKKIQELREKEKQLHENNMKSKIERMKQIEEMNFKKAQEEIRRQQQQAQQIDINGNFHIQIQGFDQQAKRKAIFDTSELQAQYNQQQKHEQPQKKKFTNADLLLDKITKNAKTEQTKKQPEEQDIQWILPQIYVKILPHQISEAFHNKKVKIVSISQPFVAKVQIGNAVLQIDQTYLETVIPKVGHKVKLLSGQLRGQNGVLQKVFLQQGYGVIEIGEDAYQVSFNNFSKID